MEKTKIVKVAPPSRIIAKRKRQNATFRQVEALSRGQTRPDDETTNDPNGLEEDNRGAKRSKLKGSGAAAMTGLDSLPWKSLQRPLQGGAGGDLGSEGAMFMFEEVDDVEVQYEYDTNDASGKGKVIKFLLKDKAKNENGSKNTTRSSKKESTSLDPVVSEVLADDFTTSEWLPAWLPLPLLPSLHRCIHALNFTSPTEIQRQAIPPALEGKDVIGIAETGSGKTLAYGLPILNHILQHCNISSPLSALILLPTRELALQVSSHLTALIPKLDNHPSIVKIASLIGGLSIQKQKRHLSLNPHIIIATPGRLWDILGEENELANKIRHELRFLVLDEADRMIETGHFKELEGILKLTLRTRDEDKIELDPAFEGMNLGADDEIDHPSNDKLQTFVFSATLSKDLQKNLKKRQKGGWKKQKSQKPASTLDELLLKLDFRSTLPEIIDLSSSTHTLSTLTESKVLCVTADKDLFLYYFLLRYPGRTLVFLGSIDGIRRLLPLLTLLGLEGRIWGLHGEMQQKQRLKNLDRFKATSNGILIATDVASRGLDVPSVDHVIHYQIPRSADVYVHRNGRTARAKREGFSLQLVGPDERKVQRMLLQSLGRDDVDVPELIVDHDILDQLRARLILAKKIDSAHHKVKKENHERNWMKETAKAMELEVDSDVLGNSDDEDDERTSKSHSKSTKALIASLKAELAQLLKKNPVSRGISTRYITSGTKNVVDDLVNATGHEMMIGLKKESAGKDSVKVIPTTAKKS